MFNTVTTAHVSHLPVRGASFEGAKHSNLFDQAVTRLRAITKAVGFTQSAIERATRALEHIMTPWGHRPVHPQWISDITEDNSAIEFSISIHNGKPEVRMMIEAQGDEPTVASQHESALELTRRLANLPGVNLERFWSIEELFRSNDPQGLYGLWHSICFTDDHDPTYKVYFNPLIDGEQAAWGKISEAMNMLGMEKSLESVRRAVRTDELDIPKYFALDLTESASARVKVYLFHRHATADYLESVVRVGKNHKPGHARNFLEAMSNSKVLRQRPVVTCFGFRGERPGAPEVNLYVPVCAYGREDHEIHDRIVNYMRDNNFDSCPYEDALRALAGRSLSTGIGIHSYVASSWRNNQLRMTIYMSPELKRVFAPGHSLGSRLGSREYQYRS